jgi:DNA-binding LacI/PurR family transcriptional regulator
VTSPAEPGAVPARRPTIYDVARAAGVSHQTVAMILRGHEKFRPQTVERVRQAIDALQYRPNGAARALATSTPNRIGALVFELLEVGPSKTVQGASRRAGAAGFLLDIMSLPPNDGEAIERALALLDRPDVAGILAFAPVDRLLDTLPATRSLTVPLVAETEPDPAAGPTLSSRGMGLIVDHLVQLGHRRIGYLGGPQLWISARRRAEAVRAALRGHGLEPVVELEGDWSAASGAAAVRACGGLAPGLAGITALICGNDQMALGALLALDDCGISVPGRMSVTGFDDIPESAYFRPPLTTVRVDYPAHGRLLVESLLARIENEEWDDTRPMDDAELVVRASTRRPPRA